MVRFTKTKEAPGLQFCLKERPDLITLGLLRLLRNINQAIVDLQ